jgi:hypothetical protein
MLTEVGTDGQNLVEPHGIKLHENPLDSEVVTRIWMDVAKLVGTS